MTALWRRLRPDTLFGRLIGVLVGGLMLAQLLSAAINVAERDQLLNRGYGLPAAQRIADVVVLLDDLPAAERERVAAVFQVPPLVLSLHEAPDLPAQLPQDRRARLFAERLQAALGAGRALRIAPRPDVEPAHAGERRRRLWLQESGGEAGRRALEPMGAESEDAALRRAAAWASAADAAAADGARAPRPPRAGRGDARGGPIWRTEVRLADGRWARFDAALPAPPERLPWTLVAQWAVLLASVLLLAWLAVRWVVRPLNLLSQAAQSLGEDLARAPLDERGPREVRQAAQAFNAMQRRLAGFIDERTRMLAALSHDLKTPLTRMRLRAELLDDDEARERFARDLQEMEAMVGETLAFLRGLGGHEPRAPVDLLALGRTLAADQAALGRSVTLEGAPAAPCVGVASLLKRLLGNLLDNAALHGGGGPVTLRFEERPGVLRVSVLDAGPGLPPAELERVFEPYRRLETSRSRATGGTGLGLSIARSIAQRHGATLSLHNRAEGGLEARLDLPR
ncbi:MAG: hypothetical protein RLY78_3724 [Pseudomonadota bacterium]